MIIYLDVLIVLNAFINFFLISLCDNLTVSNARIYRQIIAAFVGALFSLYILLPSSGFLLELLMRVVCSAAIILISFGFSSIKKFFRCFFMFYASSFIYAGAMIGLWFVLKPENMIVNNGVVYFNISPLFIILTTVLLYLFIRLVKNLIIKRHAPEGSRCRVRIEINSRSVLCDALIDTGHSVKDLFSQCPVIIVEEMVIKKLLQLNSGETLETACLTNEKLMTRYKIIPCQSVVSSGSLSSIKCDNAVIFINDKKINAGKIIAAISPQKLGEDYNSIVGKEILML